MSETSLKDRYCDEIFEDEVYSHEWLPAKAGGDRTMRFVRGIARDADEAPAARAFLRLWRVKYPAAFPKRTPAA